MRFTRCGDMVSQSGQKFKALLHWFSRLLIWIFTLPYYRNFHYNTMDPIARIVACTANPDSFRKVVVLLSRWRMRKLAELQFISIACAVLAAAVIGSFSWNAATQSYWLASAFWYCCLVLTILGILLSAQQIAVLNMLGPIPQKGRLETTARIVRYYLPLLLSEYRDAGPHSGTGIGKWKPRWTMIFTWQCPIMFLSYSVLLFLAGLTMTVCTPLIRKEPWNNSSNTAVIYLAFCTVAAVHFIFCSFLIYHYVDVDNVDPEWDEEVESNLEMEESSYFSLGILGQSQENS